MEQRAASIVPGGLRCQGDLWVAEGVAFWRMKQSGRALLGSPRIVSPIYSESLSLSRRPALVRLRRALGYEPYLHPTIARLGR